MDERVLSDSSQIIGALLSKLEESQGKPALTYDESEYITKILIEIYEFACVAGMDQPFISNFPKIVYYLKHGSMFSDWLFPQGRTPRELRQVVALILMLQVMNQNRVDVDNVDRTESLIEKNIKKRDNNALTHLLVLTRVLNEMTYGDDSERYIQFKYEHFEIQETLIYESAIMTTLATFRLACSMVETHPNVRENLQRIFKLFYIYYSNDHSLLPYPNLLYLNQEFLKRYVREGRHTKFFFEFIFRLLDAINHTPMLEAGSFYRAKYVHPFLLFEDFPSMIYNFYQKIQQNKTDYVTNFDQYAKDFKDILCYVWLEVDQAYHVALRTGVTDVSISEAKDFALQILEQIEDLYFKRNIIPEKSVIGTFTGSTNNNKLGGDYTISATDNILENVVHRGIDFIKNSSWGEKLPFINYLKNDTAKDVIKMGIKNFNIGGNLQSKIINKYVSVGFSGVTKGVLTFWKVYNQSSDLQNVTQKGDHVGAVDVLYNLVKEKVINFADKGLKKIPYGDWVTTQSTSTFLNVALHQVKGVVTKKAFNENKTFSSGQQMVVDFAQHIQTNKELPTDDSAEFIHDDSWENLSLKDLIPANTAS